MGKKFVHRLEELGREESRVVGGKSANLGEMLRLGVPVPPGFAISSAAYRRFAEVTGLLDEVSRHVGGLGELKEVAQFEDASYALRQMVREKEIPEDVAAEVVLAYRELCARTGISEVPVAVRSSGLTEDSAAASYAGQFESYLNVKGEEELLEKVKEVWSSAFTSRVLAYRMRKGMPLFEEMGVCVLKMVKARSAGIAFTADPNTGDRTKVIVEANWGLGESVVSGRVTPDRWVMEKKRLQIVERTLGAKEKVVVFMGKGVREEEAPPAKRSVFSLKDEEVREIGRFAKVLEEHYGTPQDVEWAIDEELDFPRGLFFLQTRPVIISKRDPTDRAIDFMLSRFIYG